MKFGRFHFPLLLSAGVVVSLGLFCVTSPAEDMLSLFPTPASKQPTAQGSPAPAAPAAANPSEPSAASPQNLAQSPPQAAPETPPAAAASANPPAAAAPPAQAQEPPPPTNPGLTEAELGQLLAPIALYPDQLLSQILMGSTYPVEIVAAARWVEAPAHRGLRGEALAYALRNKHWNPSVMALVPFPRVLELMSGQIEWTQKLGVAFVAQQAEIMNAVQRLRQQAIASGNFKSGPQCQCVVEEKEGFVTVAPANPAVVYCPVYDSAVIYGRWLYPAHPPYLFPLPVGFAFAPGYFIGYGVGVKIAYYGPLWGWGSVNWGGRSIIVDPVRYGAISGGHARFASGTYVAAYSGTSTVRSYARAGYSGHGGWSGHGGGRVQVAAGGWSGHGGGHGGGHGEGHGGGSGHGGGHH
jgi:hypothetical protein